MASGIGLNLQHSQMALADANNGDVLEIISISCTYRQTQRLFEIGLYPSMRIKSVGPTIVKVGETSLGIDRSLARSIVVKVVN